jgi:enoyl-CoA hydratase/carnithine racemase
MSRSTILEESRDGVAILTMSRPQRRNAFNDQQYNELREALADVQANDDLRVAVITGAPGAFSAGQDISEMGKGRGFTPFMDRLSTFDKPLLAAVNGVAVGIGFTMLLHCDIVYVAESARLRAPFVSLGIVPEAGSTFLFPATVGPQRAAEVLLTARWVSAAEAVELGMARQVVADADLLETALAKAAEIAAQPLAALRETKRLLQAVRSDALKAARAHEDAVQATRMGSPENRAAIEAFKKKRRS